MGMIFANRDAELSVVGSLMKGYTTTLTEDDFTDKDLRTAYKAIQRLKDSGKPADLVTLDKETGNVITVLLIEAQGAGIPGLLRHHEGIIRECSVRRRASEIAREIYKAMGERFNDPDTVIESAKQQLDDLNAGLRHEWTSAEELANSTVAWLEKLSKGEIVPVNSGLKSLDRLIGGFFPGELTIVGAKPGTGKTVFGMTLALDAAKRGKRVGVMNLEMLDSQYGTRIFSNLAQVDSMNLRTGNISAEDWRLLTSCAQVLKHLPASFMFSTRYIEDLRNAVKDKDLDLLVVDYMQLMRTRQNFESERLRMGYVSWALKELAIEMRIPVVVMSQLRRPDASAADKMPSMRDLRESGNLEADADGIILLHEPASTKDPYVHNDDKQAFEDWKKQGLRYIAMKVEKQRQGNVGTIAALFDGAHMRYREILRQ